MHQRRSHRQEASRNRGIAAMPHTGELPVSAERRAARREASGVARGGQLASCPPRATPDASLLAALRSALTGSSPVWGIAAMPRLREASWRWLRRWCITARAAAWAQRRGMCGMTVVADTAAAAAAEIAGDAATSAVQLHTHYVIGAFPRRRAAALRAADADTEEEEDDSASASASARPSSVFRGIHIRF